MQRGQALAFPGSEAAASSAEDVQLLVLHQVWADGLAHELHQGEVQAHEAELSHSQPHRRMQPVNVCAWGGGSMAHHRLTTQSVPMANYHVLSFHVQVPSAHSVQVGLHCLAAAILTMVAETGAVKPSVDHVKAYPALQARNRSTRSESSRAETLISRAHKSFSA